MEHFSAAPEQNHLTREIAFLRTDGPVVDVGHEKLLVDAEEEGDNVNIKLFGVHVVDQIHGDFLITTVVQILDQAEDLCHNETSCYTM